MTLGQEETIRYAFILLIHIDCTLHCLHCHWRFYQCQPIRKYGSATLSNKQEIGSLPGKGGHRQYGNEEYEDIASSSRKGLELHNGHGDYIKYSEGTAVLLRHSLS